MPFTFLNENVKVPTGSLIADGLDEGAVGYTTTSDGCEHVIYDYDKCCSIFMKENEWTYDEATEWMDFNVVAAYVGPNTPIWMFN
jgi:hypothetical protein